MDGASCFVGFKPHTPKFMLMAAFLYGFGVALFLGNQENRRPGEEYGSASWGNSRELCRRYMDKEHPDKNVILTQHVQLGLDGYKHRRNLNILVIGGSGAGKTRFFCLPGIMSANCSFLVTDPKGELLRKTGNLLKTMGYEVKVFDLINPENSDCYNPFVYLRDEKDVLKLIDNFIKIQRPKRRRVQIHFGKKQKLRWIQR